MPRISLPATIAAILAAAVPFTAAHATQAAKKQRAITVLALRSHQTGISYIGAPIDTITARSIVYIGDLNLATLAGRNRMEARIQRAAMDDCHKIDRAYPLDTEGTNDFGCTRSAVAGARPQVQAALAAAS